MLLKTVLGTVSASLNFAVTLTVFVTVVGKQQSMNSKEMVGADCQGDVIGGREPGNQQIFSCFPACSE